jgi:hypothetical protein
MILDLLFSEMEMIILIAYAICQQKPRNHLTSYHLHHKIPWPNEKFVFSPYLWSDPMVPWAS